jgi:hypothetical protein
MGGAKRYSLTEQAESKSDGRYAMTLTEQNEPRQVPKVWCCSFWNLSLPRTRKFPDRCCVFAGVRFRRDPGALTTRYVAGDKNDECITIPLTVEFGRQLLVQEEDNSAALMKQVKREMLL